jgi:hypothetical protein
LVDASKFHNASPSTLRHSLSCDGGSKLGTGPSAVLDDPGLLARTRLLLLLKSRNNHLVRTTRYPLGQVTEVLIIVTIASADARVSSSGPHIGAASATLVTLGPARPSAPALQQLLTQRRSDRAAKTVSILNRRTARANPCASRFRPDVNYEPSIAAAG